MDNDSRRDNCASSGDSLDDELDPLELNDKWIGKRAFGSFFRWRY